MILRSEGGSPAAVRWAGIVTDSRGREAGRGSIPAEGLPLPELDCNQEEHAPAHQPLEAVDDVTEWQAWAEHRDESPYKRCAGYS